MDNYPSWFENPDDPNAPLEQATDTRLMILRRVLSEQVGMVPAVVTDEQFLELIEEFRDNKRVLAMVEAETVRHAGKVDRNSNRALEALAVQAATSGLHGYHPEGYKTVGEMLRDQLADLDPDRQKSEWSNLDWIANTFVPWMTNHGQNGLEMLWSEGTKSKTRVLADVLRGQFEGCGVESAKDAPKELPVALHTTIGNMMLDVANPNVTVGQFREKYVADATHHSTMPQISGYEYLQGGGSVLVLVCPEPSQIRHVKTAVKADWKLGTGKEPVVKLLQPKKITVGKSQGKRRTR